MYMMTASPLGGVTPFLIFLCQNFVSAKMRHSAVIQASLAIIATSTAQVYNTQNSITAVAGTANDSQPNILGNYYNYWKLLNNGTTWDLTRSDRMAVTSPKTIPMLGYRKEAIIEPNRTAMIIVDMQNFFLHPQLSPHATNGRLAVQPTLNMIQAFRENGMKILWTNWGIDSFDLLTMPPSFLDGFSTNDQMNTTFCTEMGTLTETNGTTIDMGKKLCRDSWNAQPWGPLYPAMVEGLATGTDLYFNKSIDPFPILQVISSITADRRANRSPEWTMGGSNTAWPVPAGVGDDYAIHWRGEQRPVRLGHTYRRLL